MSTAFSNALAGLHANAEAIDVVSTNLSNLNTTGYKDNAVSFQDLVDQSISGVGTTSLTSGSTIEQSQTQFSQGSIVSTKQPDDAAIQGSGFFVLQTPQGAPVYTRAGNFSVDAAGNLLSSSGDNVQGWNAASGVLNTGGTVGNINLLESGLQPPIASQKFTLSANLDAGAVVGSTNANFSSPITVTDSLGQTHSLTVTYLETAAGTWTYNVNIPTADLAAGGATPTTSLATGTLTFNNSGVLTSPTAANSPVPVAITGLSDGAADMALNWNLYDTSGAPTITSYNAASTNLAATSDGSQAGQPTSVTIGSDGAIQAQYSNGNSVTVAQIALAFILNPDSMRTLGGNTYALTSATATPAIGLPDTGARGTITGGALESSTVDIATEFTNLLTFERGYQANSKVITTEDQILQQTVGLIPG
jgi:flagellar hook protein FlgE